MLFSKLHQINRVKFCSFILCMMVVSLISCTSSNKADDANTLSTETTKQDTVFFPVTNYINGEIRDILEKKLQLTQYIKKGGKTDSSFIKNDSLFLKNYFTAFLDPMIDSIYSTKLFNATQFMDETIGLLTLMFERKNVADRFPDWLGWNVYIKPETGMVEKIYLRKQIDSTQTQQFIWTHDKGCQIRAFRINASGISELLEEMRVTW